MNDKLKALVEKVDGLTLRERLIVLLAVLVSLFVVWDNFLWQPMATEQNRLQSELKQSQDEIALLNVQIGGVTARASIDPNADLKKQLANIKRSLQQVQQEVRVATATLIAPDKMVQLLESLLKAQGALRLVELRTLGPVPLIAQENKEGVASKVKKNAFKKDKKELNIYQHGFVLEFEGGYFAVLKYLRALEALDSAFFWDGVDYEVISYPQARVRLHLHTLSLSEGWIGV